MFLFLKTETLLDRIMQSFQNLNIAFMNQNIPVANDGKEEKCLASTLGEIIWPSLSDIIIKDLLEKYIPNTSSHVRNYDYLCCISVAILECIYFELIKNLLIRNYYRRNPFFSHCD